MDDSAVQRALSALQERFAERIEGAASEIAHALEQYALNHHPWEIDTGQTNETTKGRIIEFSREMVVIALSAGMDYDVFLELAHDGKWAWLWPTIMANIDMIRTTIVKWLRGGGTVAPGPLVANCG